MRPFDYLFYRVAQFYEGRWRVAEPERFGFYGFAIVLGFTLIDLAALLILATGSKYWGFFKPFGVGVTVFLTIFGFFRYNKTRFQSAKAEWDSEDPILRRRRGLCLKIYAVIVVAMPIVWGVLKHNLHWI